MRSARPTLLRPTLTLLLTAAIAACGEDGEPDRADAPPVTARAGIPAELDATWQVTHDPSSLPDSRDLEELFGERVPFRAEFHATGGRLDGPSMTLEAVGHETLVIPIAVADGEVEILDFVECRTLGYAVEGDRLTFEPAHSGCVRERTLPAILADRPWRRAR